MNTRSTKKKSFQISSDKLIKREADTTTKTPIKDEHLNYRLINLNIKNDSKAFHQLLESKALEIPKYQHHCASKVGQLDDFVIQLSNTKYPANLKTRYFLENIEGVPEENYNSKPIKNNDKTSTKKFKTITTIKTRSALKKEKSHLESMSLSGICRSIGFVLYGTIECCRHCQSSHVTKSLPIFQTRTQANYAEVTSSNQLKVYALQLVNFHFKFYIIFVFLKKALFQTVEQRGKIQLTSSLELVKTKRGMFSLIFIFFGLIYIVVNLSLIIKRNLKAHQFFKTKAPRLPVISKPGVFYGHTKQVLLHDKNWKIISDLHKKYGPSFGYYMGNQPWISTKDVDLIKLIEVDQAHKHINRSKFGLPFEEFNTSIFQVDDDEWEHTRRALSSAFAKHKVRSSEVSGDIKLLVERLQRSLENKLDKAELETAKRSLEIDIHNTMQRFSLAVVFLLIYKRDDVIDFESKEDEWVNKIDDAARSISSPLVCFAMMFPFLRPLISFLLHFHPIGKAKFEILDYLTDATEVHRSALEQHQRMQRKLSIATGAKERSFSELGRLGKYKRRMVDTIIEAFLDKKIKHDIFMGSMSFMLVAGFETMADTISCFIWLLAQHPEIQEKLRKTIENDGIDAEYVEWCIFEVIRWHPAVPLGSGRIISQDLLVNGQLYPKGAFIMPSTYSIHHDPEIWQDADCFMPERWREASTIHPAAFMGFGLGPRNCLGGKLAIHQVKLVIRMFLKSYRIEKYSETTDQYNFSSPGMIYTVLDQPIKVRLVSLSSVLDSRESSQL